MRACYRNKKYFPFVALLLCIFLSACGRSSSVHEKDVVAYVNKEPIFASELKKDMALRASLNPLFKATPEAEYGQLDMIIDKKLIIQEAMDKGLARRDKFVNTIKTFWEQTLIRDFIDYKKREFSDFLFVTDEEVKKYYDSLAQRVTFKVLKSKDKNYIDDVYGKLTENKNLQSAWQTIGPISYEDITSDALLEVFNAPVGEVKKIEEAPDYYLVVVSNREKATIMPLDTLRPEIEKRVVAMKERRLFEDWLKKQRDKASIKILKR